MSTVPKDKPKRKTEKKEMRSTNPNNPSPSGDPWWDDPRNVALVNKGTKDLQEGHSTICRTKKELKTFLAQIRERNDV